MAVLGDFGGFNDGIILLPTLFLTYYSQIVFQSAISKELLVKSKKKRNSRRKRRNTLQSRLASDQPINGNQLGSRELNEIFEETNRSNLM